MSLPTKLQRDLTMPNTKNLNKIPGSITDLVSGKKIKIIECHKRCVGETSRRLEAITDVHKMELVAIC